MCFERIRAVVKNFGLLFLILALPASLLAKGGKAGWWLGEGSVTKRGSWSRARYQAGLEARRSALADAIAKSLGRDLGREDVARLHSSLFGSRNLYAREVSDVRDYKIGRRQIVRLWLHVDESALLRDLIAQGLLYPWRARPVVAGLIVDRTSGGFRIPRYAPAAVSGAVVELEALGVDYEDLARQVTGVAAVATLQVTTTTTEEKIVAAMSEVTDVSFVVAWEYENVSLPAYAGFLFQEPPVRLRYRVFLRQQGVWDETLSRNLALDWRLDTRWAFLKSGQERNLAPLAGLVRLINEDRDRTFASLRWRLSFYGMPLTVAWRTAEAVSRKPVFSDLKPLRIERREQFAQFQFYSVRTSGEILSGIARLLPAGFAVTTTTLPRDLRVIVEDKNR